MIMDWTTIFTALAGLIGGGGLTTIFYLKPNKKKAVAEAEAVEIQNLKEVIEQLTKLHDTLSTVHKEDERTKQEQAQKILEQTADMATCQTLMCCHDACPFRQPVKGRGATWFSLHKGDDSMTDTEPITVIAKRHGYYIKRLPNAKAQDKTDAPKGESPSEGE